MAEPQEVEADGGNQTMLFGLLQGGSKRVRNILTAQYMVGSAWRIGKRQYLAARARIAYSLTIDSYDPLYGDIHTWLLSILPPTKQRSLRVQTSDSISKGDDEPVPVSGDYTPPPRSIRYLFDGTSEQQVVIGGHKVKVVVTNREEWDKRRSYSVTFTCYGVAARDVVTGQLETIAAARNVKGERLPRLYLATRWGSWDRRDELAARSPDSVILRAGVMDALIDDLNGFLTNERRYLAMGMPFHRGYLFHGPPGTGKSSVARALATHFGLDLYYLPLGDLSSDADLIQMISHVPKRSVLLLEDIDTFGIARKRDEEDTDHTTGGMSDPGASLSGLLNALDGLATPHGLIVMMTTNNRGDLDDALLRDFRVNIDQHIDYLDQLQLDRLLERFVDPQSCPFVPIPINAHARLTPAQVLGIVMANLDAPDKAVHLITELARRPAPEPL